MGPVLAHSLTCVGPRAVFILARHVSDCAAHVVIVHSVATCHEPGSAAHLSERRFRPTADRNTSIPAEAAVAIVIELTTYRVIGYGGFTLSFARRLVVVDGTGVLADWRVQCDAPTLFVHDDLFNAPNPEVTRRMPLKTYTEALRGLSQLLTRRYMVFHDRDAVLDALRLSLPLDRTTYIGQNMPIRNSALCVGGTCWCRSRRTLVDLEVLLRQLLG